VGLGFDGKAIGTSNWYNPGAAHNGWYGFCSVLIIAAFAYSGSEVVGLTAAEQEDPKRDMPRAIRKVFWRVGLVRYPCCENILPLTSESSSILLRSFSSVYLYPTMILV